MKKVPKIAGLKYDSVASTHISEKILTNMEIVFKKLSDGNVLLQVFSVNIVNTFSHFSHNLDSVLSCIFTGWLCNPPTIAEL